MEDKRKNNGGHKTAGRKPKVEEQKVNTLFLGLFKMVLCVLLNLTKQILK